MHIQRVELVNIRAFPKLELPPEGAALSQCSVLIGGNSTCKTTVLRCIALGLCNQTHASALLSELPGSLVGPRGNEATIQITLVNDTGDSIVVKTTLRREDLTRAVRSSTPSTMPPTKMVEDSVISQQHVVNEKESGPEGLDRGSLFVCGYGAGRGVVGTESWSRYRIIDSVYTLFRYDEPLQNPELILKQVKIPG